MSDLREVAVTSDTSGQLWNTCVWDPHVGTTLMTYKGGVSNSHCLSFICRDFLISADAAKPLIHVWALNRQEQIQVRMVCPSKVSALAVSPDGTYCVCGIDETMYVWHIGSGRLMAVISRHFQKVNCLKFTDDTSHFASASADGSVIIWPLGKVVSMTRELFRDVSDCTEPRYVFAHHSLSVTDVFIGKGGMRARLVTVSLDNTSKIYDLASGMMLLSIVFDVGLTCVGMNSCESHMFVGATDGKIYQYFLHNPPRSLDYHLNEEEKENVFSEHTQTITCLSVSADGLTLMSGSLDEQVIIWDVYSRQCLRKLQHKGAITNAFFAFVPMNVFSNDLKASLILSSFRRRTDSESEEGLTIHVLNHEDIQKNSVSDHVPKDTREHGIPQAVKLNKEISKVKKCNKELFGFIVNNILEEGRKSNTLPGLKGNKNKSPGESSEKSKKRKKP